MADFSKFYRGYMYMQELLKNDFTYNYINESFKDGDEGEDTLSGKTNEKVIDMDWVEAIEDALPYIQKAIDEQRRFIKQVENVVRIELAKKVGPDSVKHLSQHTNFIAKVENGMVTPNKILTTEREESFAIYENRVLMTLIRKALYFVDDKYSKMKDVPNDSYHNIKVARHVEFNEKVVDFNINYVNESHESLADDLDVLDVTALSDFDRIRRIRTTLNEFLNTQLMREIAKEPEVHPPITQTNLLKKNPNFKKAMELWNFLDSYKRPGFEIVGEEYSGKMNEAVRQDIYFSMGFQHFVMSIATNPGLRNILHQKYEEENRRLEEESERPQKTEESVIKARIDAARKEEMELRLKEIREREKKILELTNEIKNLKVTIDQKEHQILTLKGQVSVLEDKLAELKDELQQTKMRLLEAEHEIENLKEENQALKGEIERLNGIIGELNTKIDELNKKIGVLNDRIITLMQENAQMKAKLDEQEKLIEAQTARINELEVQTAEQLATITAQAEHIAKCEAQMQEDAGRIADLENKNEVLNNTLVEERREAKETVEKMNLDFAEKLNLAEQKRIKDLADSRAEFDTQLENVRKANEETAQAVSVKHASELKRVQKSVDKRVEQAEKDAEKRMQAKINEINKNAQAQIRRAEKKANEKAVVAREEAKAIRNTSDIHSRDYAFGSVNVISKYAEQLAKNSQVNFASALTTTAKSIKALTVSATKKGVALSLYTPSGIKVIKLYKKDFSLLTAVDGIAEHIKNASNVPICVTYSGVNKEVADEFCNRVKATVENNVSLVQNKALKSGGFIAIYFCME